jgi:hypothetical protein
MTSFSEPPAESEASNSAAGPDPELQGLPTPRRPWRKTTIFTLISCLVMSVTLLVGLRGELAFSAQLGPPTLIGNLSGLRLLGQHGNLWVQADGDLADHGGIRYQRPFETDSYRLVPVQGNSRLWVQVRVPAGYEDDHFVPPTSFVGRLLRVDDLGVRYSVLRQAVTDAGWPKGQLPDDAWILVDGESPKAIRWVLALAIVLLGFASFCLWATAFVVRPARLL